MRVKCTTTDWPLHWPCVFSCRARPWMAIGQFCCQSFTLLLPRQSQEPQQVSFFSKKTELVFLKGKKLYDTISMVTTPLFTSLFNTIWYVSKKIYKGTWNWRGKSDLLDALRCLQHVFQPWLVKIRLDIIGGILGMHDGNRYQFTTLIQHLDTLACLSLAAWWVKKHFAPKHTLPVHQCDICACDTVTLNTHEGMHRHIKQAHNHTHHVQGDFKWPYCKYGHCKWKHVTWLSLTPFPPMWNWFCSGSHF